MNGIKSYDMYMSYSSHVSFKHIFCMYVWDLGQRSDFQKMLKFVVITNSFPYSDSPFVTYKAFLKLQVHVPLRVDFIQWHGALV